MAIATNLSQSKTLAKLGLKRNDMWWSSRFIAYETTPKIGIASKEMFLYTSQMSNEDIPAWSLESLLDHLPQEIIVEKRGEDYEEFTLGINKEDDITYNIFYKSIIDDEYLCDVISTSAVDCAFEVLCYLLKRYLL